MEVRLSGSPNVGLLLSLRSSQFSSSPLRGPSLSQFSLNSWVSHQNFSKQHFRYLAQTWSFRTARILKSQILNKRFSVHVVKEGETFSSISEQYGIPIHSIAALNKSIVDLDLVYEGQQLKIPLPKGCIDKTEKKRSVNFESLQKYQKALKMLDASLKEKNVAMLIFPELPYARTTGYFLVLVPLIAFCIRCINGAFCTRIAVYLRLGDIIEPKPHDHTSRSLRWKSALFDTEEPDNSDSESTSNVGCPANDKAQTSPEDDVQAYGKLEEDYQKFLSECGISSSGYWRGGLDE